jgi:steroid 5-alpha reductase family enzyme
MRSALSRIGLLKKFIQSFLEPPLEEKSNNDKDSFEAYITRLKNVFPDFVKAEL